MFGYRLSLYLLETVIDNESPFGSHDHPFCPFGKIAERKGWVLGGIKVVFHATRPNRLHRHCDGTKLLFS